MEKISTVTYRIDNMGLILPSHIPGLFRESEIVKYVASKTSPEKESYFTVATFKYDKLGFPVLLYCGRRPLDLSKEERDVFMTLVETGYKYIQLDDGRYEKVHSNTDGMSEG